MERLIFNTDVLTFNCSNKCYFFKMKLPESINITIPEGKHTNFLITVENDSFAYEKISVLESSCDCVKAINITETLPAKTTFDYKFTINRVSNGRVNITFFNHNNAEQKSVVVNVTINE